MEGTSLGGELVLVSACLTVSPLITGGQAHTNLFKISCRAEVVTSPRRSITATSLTSAGCHLTCLASELGWVHQKVRLYYGTFPSGLRQLSTMPPSIYNYFDQQRLNAAAKWSAAEDGQVLSHFKQILSGAWMPPCPIVAVF
jgi:hypothetical protein